MKKYVLAAFLLISIQAFTQNFEGTIKWSLKMDITDPKQKAQMEEAQKKLSDPATQAQMKEMQSKMNDPQFKAMMESNPQMKAQIEKMMSGMQQGGGISSMMPKGLVIKIKDKNSLVKMDGGMFASEILHLNSKDQSYSLDRQNKTYSILNTPAKSDKTSPTLDYKVTKTSETAKILNYSCTKYIVEVTSHETKINQYIWATTEIKDFDLKALAKQRMGNGGQRLFYDNIDGVPLKTEMKMQSATMIMEVTEIKKESIDQSLFVIPSDFKEVP